jgi:hypothetical protein
MTKILYAILISPTHATCTVHLILHDHYSSIVFGEAKKNKASNYAVFSILMSSFVSPNILLSMLNLHSSLNVTDENFTKCRGYSASDIMTRYYPSIHQEGSSKAIKNII